MLIGGMPAAHMGSMNAHAATSAFSRPRSGSPSFSAAIEEAGDFPVMRETKNAGLPSSQPKLSPLDFRPPKSLKIFPVRFGPDPVPVGRRRHEPPVKVSHLTTQVSKLQGVANQPERPSHTLENFEHHHHSRRGGVWISAECVECPSRRHEKC